MASDFEPLAAFEATDVRDAALDGGTVRPGPTETAASDLDPSDSLVRDHPYDGDGDQAEPCRRMMRREWLPTGQTSNLVRCSRPLTDHAHLIETAR